MAAPKQAVKKLTKRITADAEKGARQDLAEQFMYDFSRSKANVYWTNFFRGIFFGVGSVLGGTLVVAILVSILSMFADMPGVFGQFIQYIVDVVNIKQR